MLIEVCLSEYGTIYVVAGGTGRDSTLICESCICSAEMTAHVSRKISLTGAVKEGYWIYAMDPAGNISEPYPVCSQWTGVRNRPYDGVFIYPTPARDFVNIASRWPDRTDVRIADLKGVITTETFMEGGTLQLDISTFPPGPYLLFLISDQAVTTRKIIKF